MQSLNFRPSLQWLCLLLFFMSVSVGATPEEGAILLNWRNNMTHSGGELANWGAAGSSDPCGNEANWFHVSCDNTGYVRRLDLDSLGLSGTLAPELGLFSKLESLSLYNNSFSRSIPQEMGNLSTLVLLNLSENQLSGPIPDTFAKLTNLQYLTLNSNKFSGSFLESLTLLHGLSSINLDSNSISGELNVTRLLELIQAMTIIYRDEPLGVVSLMNNNVTNVAFQPSDLLNNRIVFKVQGNPYCSISMELYDDGRRCFCQQNCSITIPQQGTPKQYPLRQGAILMNWKNQLTNTSTGLINWRDETDPCGSNPWFHVLCDHEGNVQRLDLGNSGLEGPLVPELGGLSKLTTLTLYGNNLNGNIPEELGNLSSLQILDLSDNQFSGSIPKTFGKLQSLTYLNLNNNNLTGSFPESLLRDFQLLTLNLDNNAISRILNYTHLREIVTTIASMNQSQTIGGIVSLRNNSITDVKYMPHDFDNGQEFIYTRLDGTPYCYNSTKSEGVKKCFCEGNCTMIPRTIRVAKNSQRLAIIIATISVFVVFLFATSLGVMFKRHAKLKLRKLQVEYENKFVEFEVNPQPFLYNELRFATQDFNETTKLGQGSFGTVYKGVLSNGNVVAIKKLEPKSATHGELDDFLNEVVFITKMKHRNLVNLKGYCMRGKERMLVYEYVENMDVEQCLLKGQKKEAMTWHVRFNICLGVAQGLHYLHTYAKPRVIHRDIKASNILLDAHYIPKIADFGLALLFPDEKTHISTANVAGTRGYLAPEYVLYGQLSEKADVYSFGVLCLEVISGRRNIDPSMPANKVYLPSWAWILYGEGKLKDLIDPSMRLLNDEEMEVLQFLNIVLSCLEQNPDRRPSMNDVQIALQGKMKLELPLNEMVESITMEDLELESLISCVGCKNDANIDSISRDSTLFSSENEIMS